MLSEDQISSRCVFTASFFGLVNIVRSVAELEGRREGVDSQAQASGSFTGSETCVVMGPRLTKGKIHSNYFPPVHSVILVYSAAAFVLYCTAHPTTHLLNEMCVCERRRCRRRFEEKSMDPSFEEPETDIVFGRMIETIHWLVPCGSQGSDHAFACSDKGLHSGRVYIAQCSLLRRTRGTCRGTLITVCEGDRIHTL